MSNPKSTSKLIPPAESPASEGLGARNCSASALRAAEKRGYGKGYFACRGHKADQVRKLEAEIRELKAKPAGHDEAVAYLLETAEAMTAAARMLIQIRTPANDVPNK